MKKELIGYGILIILLLLFIIALPRLMDHFSEKKDMRNQEWDNKYKPICKELGGLYLEDGYTHYNYCYLNYSGILRKSCMIEKLNGWYLVECSP